MEISGSLRKHPQKRDPEGRPSSSSPLERTTEDWDLNSPYEAPHAVQSALRSAGRGKGGKERAERGE